MIARRVIGLIERGCPQAPVRERSDYRTLGTSAEAVDQQLAGLIDDRETWRGVHMRGAAGHEAVTDPVAGECPREDLS